MKNLREENWIREHRDEYIDWNSVSSFAPRYSLDFLREFRKELNMLWICYALDIEQREDIIREFELDRVIEQYNLKVDGNK